MPVTNPISVSPNADYGGPEGYNKYSPFNAITVINAAPNITDYDFMVSDRAAVLFNLGVFPSDLRLASPNWAARIADENGGGAAGGHKNPPLVVVSSNRSRYIQAGIAAVDVQRAAAGVVNFNNISDLRALGTDPATPSPPIYCPRRLNANDPRSVYVIVHFSEYRDYIDTLAGSGINVIGWQFAQPRVAPGMLTGFGATRYAAIEFCKQLRMQAATAAGGNAPWDVAWLFDDNVVGITSLQSLTAIETAVTENTWVCAGFRGLAQPQNRANTLQWAGNVPPNQQQGLNIPDLPAGQPNGLVQQAACWNIQQLQNQNLNFSPIFVTSKEDVSFSNYFDKVPVSYRFYNTKMIRKETVTLYDNAVGLTGSNAVMIGRARYTTSFAGREGPIPIQPPNPAPATTLGPCAFNIVRNSNALTPAAKNNLATAQQAICQGSESIITKAIGGLGNASVVTSALLTTTFRPATVPATAATLTVQRLNVP